MNDSYKNHMRRKEDSFMGLITGIAIGVAAALLTREDNRNKLKKAWRDMQNRGADLLDETSKKAEDLTRTARKKTRQIAERTRSSATTENDDTGNTDSQ